MNFNMKGTNSARKAAPVVTQLSQSDFGPNGHLAHNVGGQTNVQKRVTSKGKKQAPRDVVKGSGPHARRNSFLHG